MSQPPGSDGLAALERQLGYVFRSRALLSRALTHRSFGSDHNERLEFLGDGALNFAIASILYERHPGMDEGDLSRLRASLVRQGTLHEISVGLGIGGMLKLGEGELRSGGAERPTILADALEAVLGAAYVDGGFDVVRAAVIHLWGPRLEHATGEAPAKDPKTALQERLQARHLPLPVYSVVEVRGEAHRQVFRVRCEVSDPAVMAEGEGASRRSAEQAAAQAALGQLAGKVR